MEADRIKLDKAAAASMRTLAMDQKLPSYPPTSRSMVVNSSQIEVFIAGQRRIENAIKGAGSSTSKPIDFTTPVLKGAPGQSFLYLYFQSDKSAPSSAFICYAATLKDDNYIRRDEDSHDDDGKPLVVWGHMTNNAHGKLSNKIDLSTIFRDEMVPFDLQNPPTWMEMITTGRNWISRGAGQQFLHIGQ